MTPSANDIVTHLLKRLRQVQSNFGVPETDNSGMRLGDAVDSMGLVEFVGVLAEAMTQVDFEGFSPKVIRQHAMRFSKAVFKERLFAEIARLTGEPEPERPAEGARVVRLR